MESGFFFFWWYKKANLVRMISVWAGSLEGLHHVCHVLPEGIQPPYMQKRTHTRARKSPFFLAARQESVFICPID